MQKEFEKRVDPNDKGGQALLEEMRQHVKKVRRSVGTILLYQVPQLTR